MGALVTVMGIDIKPGYSPRSTRTPRYAVVVLRDGEVLERIDNVPLHTVVRLILEYHVDVLAVDNVYELVEDSQGLARLSDIIPSWCKVVEVTSSERGFISVEELARELGLHVKPSTPIETAFVNAYAAYRGYGRVVKLPSDRVYILVSKGRTPSQGGASSDRFKRSIRASVLQLVKEIKEALDRSGVDYDLVVKKSDGGLERGLFVVYSTPEIVRSIVTPIKCKNVKVVIKPATSTSPRRRKRRAILLGVDPGMSVGVAALDLDGRPLLVQSYKNPDREQIIADVLALGKPFMVAVDVAKPPDYVKKVAAALRALLYTPEEDLSVEEKQRIVNDYVSLYGVEVPDAHARDALAAAVKAYRQVKPLIDEVESKIRHISGLSRDEVVVQVLRGRPLSEVLEEAFIKVLSRGKVVEPEERRSVKTSSCPEEVTRLQARVLELQSKVMKLEEELKRRDELLENLEMELRFLRKRPVDEECERRVNQLQVELEALRKLLVEKSTLINAMRDKVTMLENLLVETALGKKTLACKSHLLPRCEGLPVYVASDLDLPLCVEYARSRRTGVLFPRGSSAPSWVDLRVPVLEVDIALDLGDYVLVDSSVVGEIKSIWSRIEELEARERRDRILKMIKEYQESRKRELRTE
mgnify:CR=1 FL=1